jgi:hypothetical protein
MTNIESKPLTRAEFFADLSAIANDWAEREHMFAQGFVTIFEAIYGPFGPRLRADLVDYVERLYAQRDLARH